MRFTALVDFWSQELASHYCAGLSYTAGPEDDKLRQLIPQWIANGWVIEGGGVATLTGKE